MEDGGATAYTALEGMHEERLSSKANVLSRPQVDFPTKKLRLKSLLWAKPTGTAISSMSSFLAQLFPILIINLASISSGLGVGFSTVALYQLQARVDTSSDDGNHGFKVEDGEKSWIGGMYGLGTVVGGVASTIVATKWGRRRCMLLMTVPDALGWILIAASINFRMVLAGRFLTGLSATGYLHSILIYTAEVSQPQHRSVLTAITIPASAMGALIAYCLGSVAPWYIVATVGCFIPLILIPGLLMIPNSPYWYLQRGEDKLAIQALQKFRSSDADALSELLAMTDHYSIQLGNEYSKRNKSWSATVRTTLETIGHRRNRKPLLVLNGLFFLMFCSGNLAVSFHAVEILRKASPVIIDANAGELLENDSLLMVAIGALKFVASLCFLPAVKYCRRRFLLVTSTIVMGLGMSSLGFQMHVHSSEPTHLTNWVPMVTVAICIMAGSLGLGSLPYVYTAEFFSTRMRSLLSGITICLSQLEWFVAMGIFPKIFEMGGDITFWVYAVVCFTAVVFTVLFVPETKGKTLEEIENFAFKKTLHLSPYKTPKSQRQSGKRSSPSIQFPL